LSQRVKSFTDVLPEELLRLLEYDAIAISKMESSQESLLNSKRHTRWFPKDQAPRTSIEEALLYLLKVLRPSDEYVGLEWWVQSISAESSLGFHVDKDESVASHQHYLLHPEWSSVFYLSDTPLRASTEEEAVKLRRSLTPDTSSKIGGTAGTLITDQWSPEGNGFYPFLFN